MSLRRAATVVVTVVSVVSVGAGCAPDAQPEASVDTTTTTTSTGPATTSPATTGPSVGATDTTVPGPVPPATAQGDVASDRPYRVVLPTSPQPGRSLPVVMLVHGYSGTSDTIATETGLLAEADRRGAVVVLPDGVVDLVGNQFWNATDACCDFWGAGQDDSSYLAAVMREVLADHPVDPQRVAVVGHSNGGFMAYRMACDHADLVTAVASLAGAMALAPADCAPSRPVRVLQVHGTLDGVVRYGGGRLLGGPPHPGALESVLAWAVLNGCTGRDPVSRGAPLDIDATVDGAESVRGVVDGCPRRGTVDLVRVEGGGHFPWGGTDFAPTLFDVLLEPSAP